MKAYFKRLDTRGHFGDFWHKAKSWREDKKISARMERRRLNMSNPNIDYGAPALRMEATIYLPLKPGETKTEAEDRMIETLENAGIILTGWTGETEIVDWEG